MKRILFLLLFGWMTTLLSAQETEPADSLVRLLSAQQAKLIEKNGRNFREVTGDVRFLHNNTYLHCDTALWNVDSEYIDAIGNVKIIQENTILSGDKLHYILKKDLAQFRGTLVELLDKDGNCLRTKYLDYNTRDSVATFWNGGSMRDEDGNVIESQRGMYESKISKFSFNRRVQMFSDTLFFVTDSLRYYSDRNYAEFSSNTKGWRNDNYLEAQGGWYNREQERLYFEKDVYIRTPDYEIWCERLHYDRNQAISLLEDRVRILDTANQTAILTNRLLYEDWRKYAELTDSPAIIYYGKDEQGVRDTLFFGADTLIYQARRMYEIDSAVVEVAKYRKEQSRLDPVGSLIQKRKEAQNQSASQGNRPGGATGGAAAPATRPNGGNTSGQTAPGQTPPGQTPPGQNRPGQAPPGQNRPGQTPPGQTAPPVANRQPAASHDYPTTKSPSGPRVVEYEDLLDFLRESDSTGVAPQRPPRPPRPGNSSADSMQQRRNRPPMDSLRKNRPQMPQSDSLEKNRPQSDSLWKNRPPMDSLRKNRPQSPQSDSLRQSGPVKDSLQFAAPTDSLGTSTVADTTQVVPEAPKDTTQIIFLRAYHRVRMYRTDMQVICDSLEYTGLDSIARLYKDPVLWNEVTNQLTSDSMQLIIEDGKLTKGILNSSAYLIAEQDTLFYNQIKGAEMIGYFRDSELYRFDALGGASALFFLAEDSSITTMNQKESTMLSSMLKDNTIERSTYFEKVKNDFFPIVELTPEQKFLRDFHWRPEDRPQDRYAITDGNVPESERRRPVHRFFPKFTTTETYFPGYIPGILREIEVRDSLSRLPRVPVLVFDIDTLEIAMEEIPVIPDESILKEEVQKEEPKRHKSSGATDSTKVKKREPVISDKPVRRTPPTLQKYPLRNRRDTSLYNRLSEQYALLATAMDTVYVLQDSLYRSADTMDRSDVRYIKRVIRYYERQERKILRTIRRVERRLLKRLDLYRKPEEMD